MGLLVVKLLPRKLLIKTGPVDHADWNYRPFLAKISRVRFSLVRSMLDGESCSRLLELGYGSGVFLPELALHTRQLYGADIHRHSGVVSRRLAALNLHAELHTCDTRALPFPEAFFQCVVAVSVLEFVDDLSAACREIKRVLTPDGILVVATPRISPILDVGLRLLTGESAKHDFSARREQVIPTLKKYFVVAEERTAGLLSLKLYTGLKLCPLPQVQTPQIAAA